MSNPSETKVEKKDRMKQKYSVWTFVCDEHKFLVKRILLQKKEKELLKYCNIENCANLATTFGYVEIKW